MFGGTRNGRVMKLAAVVGLFLFVLYFLISWRMEAQTLAQNLSAAEEEYQALIKRYSRLEKELKDFIVKETKLQESLREEQLSISDARTALSELEAKCQNDVKSCKAHSASLQGEKTELQEQIKAVKADGEAKAQEVQRLTEELHETKQTADDEYQALSATCTHNQQTCEQRAKEAEENLVTVRAEASTTYTSLQGCKTQLATHKDMIVSCNTRKTSLEEEGASKLEEIEQLQSQLHLAQQHYESVLAQLHEQQDSQLLHHNKVAQPVPGVEEEAAAVHDIKRRGNAVLEGGNGDFHRANPPALEQGNEFHRNGVVNRYQREAVPPNNDRFRDWKEANDFGIRDQQFDLPRDRFAHGDFKKAGEVKESFDDIRISDEQKRSVFDSLHGKLSRGEKLDERQSKIYQMLSREFEHAKEHARKDVPLRNGMGMEDYEHEQQKQPADGGENERLDSKQQQLPDPLDDREEVKDLVEEHQKPDEFDNIGRERKLDNLEKEQEDAAGAGGAELKQLKEGDHEDLDEEDKQYLHEDDDLGKKVDIKDDHPLPKPIQNMAMPDDEDAYGAKEKHEGDKENQDIDMYGDQAYKRDQELFKHERLQAQKFHRQL